MVWLYGILLHKTEYIYVVVDPICLLGRMTCSQFYLQLCDTSYNL